MQLLICVKGFCIKQKTLLHTYVSPDYWCHFTLVNIFESPLRQCFTLSLEKGGKLKRMQIEMLLLLLLFVCANKANHYILSLSRSLSRELFILKALHDLAVQITCVCLGGVSPSFSDLKWHSGHVRFTLRLCNFRCNEPANLYFIRPGANGEKGGVILVPVGHSPSRPYISLFSCQFSLLQRWGWSSVYISLETGVPFPHWLN